MVGSIKISSACLYNMLCLSLLIIELEEQIFKTFLIAMSF